MKQLDSQVQSFSLPPPPPTSWEQFTKEAKTVSTLWCATARGFIFRSITSCTPDADCCQTSQANPPDSDTDYSIHAYATRTVISSEGNPQPDRMKLRDYLWRKSKQWIIRNNNNTTPKQQDNNNETDWRPTSFDLTSLKETNCWQIVKTIK